MAFEPDSLVKGTWHNYKESADKVGAKVRSGFHWIILFEPQTHSGHVVRFQQEFFAFDKTGFEAVTVPMTIEGIGVYPLSFLIVDKKRVTAQMLADYMNSISGVKVTAHMLERQDMLYWVANSDNADFITMMFQLYLGDRI